MGWAFLRYSKNLSELPQPLIVHIHPVSGIFIIFYAVLNWEISEWYIGKWACFPGATKEHNKNCQSSGSRYHETSWIWNRSANLSTSKSVSWDPKRQIYLIQSQLLAWQITQFITYNVGPVHSSEIENISSNTARLKNCPLVHIN